MHFSLLLAVGLVLVWVGERIVEAPVGRYGLTGTGALMVAVAAVGRLLRARTVKGEVARVQRLLAAFNGLAVFALALYAIQSDLLTTLTQVALSTQSPKLAGALAVLWPGLLAVALLPTLLMELSFASMAKAPKLEDGRINEAMLSGLGISCALIFVFSVQYVATERNVTFDLSHFRAAKAG